MFQHIKDLIQNLSFGANKWQVDGIHKKTKTKYDPKGWDINGWDKNKFNKETGGSYDKYGYNYFGFNKDGYDKSGNHYTQSDIYYNSILLSNNGILIALLAKIAKSDGGFSQNEAIYINQTIDDIHIDANFKKAYAKIANREKEITSNIEHLCKSLPITALRNITYFLQKLVGITAVDGVFYEPHYTMMLEIMHHLHVDDKTRDVFISELNKMKSSFNKDIEIVRDKEMEKLKQELKILENKLQTLSQQKTEYLNEIDEFNQQYNLHLGELIKTILNLKKEILYKKTIKKQHDKEKYRNDFATYEDTQNDIDELKETLAQLEEALEQMDEEDENYDEISKAYQELQEELDKLEEELFAQKEALDEMESSFEEDGIETEYEEMKSAYEDFENEYEHIKEEFESKLSITDEDKQELKKLYKKAARLCHPDIVADELKDKAHALMQQLNDAYSKMDLVAIKEMLKSLENGISFLVASDSINDKELLKAKIDELKEKIQAIKEEIEQIQSDETYQVIQKLDDWDGYFEELKTTLEEEKGRLEKEASVVSHENDLFEESDFYDNALHTQDDGIAKEESPYARHIKSIENPSFERIRRYCNNLVDDHKADEMQKDLAQNGKMHKALIYDALEQFIERLESETITLIDWGCGQGIGSMIVLDYIREKQLDIKVDQMILIDNDSKALSRAMAQVEALAFEKIDIKAFNSDDLTILESIENNITLNLIVNDEMPVDSLDIDFELLAEAYIMCISNENKEFVDGVYEDIGSFANSQDVSIRDGKIGKFERYERIIYSNN